MTAATMIERRSTVPDFRVADTAPEHPKLRAAGLAGFGLWSAAGGYAMRELTDGWVPDYWVQTWPGAKAAARRLIEVGLWVAEPGPLGQPGYRFRDWLDYQRSAAQIEEEKQRARDRAAKSYAKRAPNLHRRSGEASPDLRNSLSLSLSPSGSSGGVSLDSTSEVDQEPPTRNPPNGRPADRCSKHLGTDHDGACRACASARELAERWDADTARRRVMAARGCQWCDAEGWRIDPANRHRGPLHPGRRCDHTPLTPEMLGASA
jgi:hypothetical protein